MEHFLKLVIPFDKVKKGKLDNLVHDLIGGVWGTIERNSEKQYIQFSSDSFCEIKIAIKKVEKYLIADRKI